MKIRWVPRSLFDQARAALVKAAENGNLRLNSEQQNIPPGIRELIWEKSTIKDIMQIASNPGFSDWFSDISDNQVQIRIRISRDQYGVWNSCIRIAGKGGWISLISVDNPPEYMIDEFMHRIVNQTSSLRNRPWSPQSTFKFIEWLVELYQSPVLDIYIDGGGMVFENFVSWSTLLDAQTVSFVYCHNMDVLRKVLEGRRDRKLNTFIRCTHFEEPILLDLQLFKNVLLYDCSFDLKNTDFKSFVDFAAGLNYCDGVKVETPEFGDREFKVLERRLKLVGNGTKSHTNRGPRLDIMPLPGKSGHQTFHSYFLTFRFLINDSGVYTNMEMDLPSRRGRRS
ncbi:hypothetical protein CAEBREN_05035 [Caenorhabditis brenneri]|uniref:Uncharacterized protein n=1 Tax=Caenorhabditis brenneri TaxID=135651 RepID=G0NZB0_CAEBE|nr:hypothetical protein CAEBREN_05035 [Caenorhabditis brenneri]